MSTRWPLRRPWSPQDPVPYPIPAVGLDPVPSNCLYTSFKTITVPDAFGGGTYEGVGSSNISQEDADAQAAAAAASTAYTNAIPASGTCPLRPQYNYPIPDVGPLVVTGIQGVPVSSQLSATNSPVSWSLSANISDQGVNVDSYGKVYGTFPVSGTFYGNSFATNYGGTGTNTATFMITTPGPPVITSPLTDSISNDLVYNYQITATNSPIAFNATGLPSGLMVDTSTGLIYGTVTGATLTDNYNIVLTATNSEGSDTETLVLTVIASTTIQFTRLDSQNGLATETMASFLVSLDGSDFFAPYLGTYGGAEGTIYPVSHRIEVIMTSITGTLDEDTFTTPSVEITFSPATDLTVTSSMSAVGSITQSTEGDVHNIFSHDGVVEDGVDVNPVGAGDFSATNNSTFSLTGTRSGQMTIDPNINNPGPTISTPIVLRTLWTF